MSLLRTAVMPAVALVVLLLLIGVMAGVFRDRIVPGTQQRDLPVSAETRPVESRRSASTEAVPASVEARETTIVASRLLARVRSIGVRAGDYVEAGQVLVSLEQEDLQARARQAEESVRSVQARLTEAQQSLERAKELRQKQLIAEADLDAAEANALSLEAELAAARQGLAEARTALGYAQIRSPLAGRVVDRFAEPGDTVSPGQKILSLYNPFSLRIEAWVRESLALTLEEGQGLSVQIPALDRKLEARIEEIVPAADPGSRAFRVKATLAGEPGLLPGMYARLLVPAGEREQILVPEDHVARVGQLDVVWVQESAGPARRFVRLGEPSGDGWIAVIAGLSPGEQLLPPPSR